jgi:hypothetical protein
MSYPLNKLKENKLAFWSTLFWADDTLYGETLKQSSFENPVGKSPDEVNTLGDIAEPETLLNDEF